MNLQTKQKINKSVQLLNENAKKFGLDGKDLSNLFDIFYMLEWKDLIGPRDRLWFDTFYHRLKNAYENQIEKQNEDKVKCINSRDKKGG